MTRMHTWRVTWPGKGEMRRLLPRLEPGEDHLPLAPVDADEAAGPGVGGDPLTGEGRRDDVDHLDDLAAPGNREPVDDLLVVAGGEQPVAVPDPAREAVVAPVGDQGGRVRPPPFLTPAAVVPDEDGL